MSIEIIKTNEGLELVSKADYDKLAAAHSELRESMAAIHNTIKLDGASTSLSSILSASNRAYEASSPTDATIAEFKAQGVDLSANELKALAERSRADAPVAAEHIHSAALYLMIIAAELRAGVK